MRLDNWDLKLVQFARDVNGLPFEWGKTDCATLVRRAMQAMYGRDLWPELGVWKTKIGAKRAIIGIDNPLLLLQEVAQEVPPAYAQTGDIAWTPGTDTRGLPQFAVILTGDQVLVAVPETPVAVLEAWRTRLHENTRIFRVMYGE